MELTKLQSRQHLIKAVVRLIALFDAVHMAFPIILFTNLSLYGAIILFGPRNKENNGRRLYLVITPIGVVGIIVFSYGLIIVLRLFNSTNPEIPPLKSADLAMWWWVYSLVLVVIEEAASAIYFYLGEKEDDFVGQVFSITTNFSVSIRIVSLYVVKKFIQCMRRKDYELISRAESSAGLLNPTEPETLVMQARRQSRLPLSPSRNSILTVSRPQLKEYMTRQNMIQMMFLAKTIVVLDLIQNTFMVLTLCYLLFSMATVAYNKNKNTDTDVVDYVEFDFTIPGAVYAVALLVVFLMALYTGLKLLTAADEGSDMEILEDLDEPAQANLKRSILKWQVCSLACIIFSETNCLLLITLIASSRAMIVVSGLSFSIAIRVVSLYLVARFKSIFFPKTFAGGGETGPNRIPVSRLPVPSVKVSPAPIELEKPVLDIKRHTLDENYETSAPKVLNDSEPIIVPIITSE